MTSSLHSIPIAFAVSMFNPTGISHLLQQSCHPHVHRSCFCQLIPRHHWNASGWPVHISLRFWTWSQAVDDLNIIISATGRANWTTSTPRHVSEFVPWCLPSLLVGLFTIRLHEISFCGKGQLVLEAWIESWASVLFWRHDDWQYQCWDLHERAWRFEECLSHKCLSFIDSAIHQMTMAGLLLPVTADSDGADPARRGASATIQLAVDDPDKFDSGWSSKRLSATCGNWVAPAPLVPKSSRYMVRFLTLLRARLMVAVCKKAVFPVPDLRKGGYFHLLM